MPTQTATKPTIEWVTLTDESVTLQDTEGETWTLHSKDVAPFEWDEVMAGWRPAVIVAHFLGLDASFQVRCVFDNRA